MDPSSLASLFLNGTTAVAVIVAIVFGYLVPMPTHARVLKENTRKDAVIERLQEALALERQRSNDATQAGAVTNQLITSLVRLADGSHRDDHHDAAPVPLPAAAGAPDRGGEGIGL